MKSKLKRRLLKLSSLAKRLDSIELIEQKSKVLIVGNGGLENGVQSQQVHEIFSRYGRIKGVNSHRDRPYCLVEYVDENGAVEGQRNTNGMLFESNGRLIRALVAFVAPNSSFASLKNSSEQVNIPQGLIYVKDFISDVEENRLVDIVNEQIEAGGYSQLQNRKVIHFGRVFDYQNNSAGQITNQIPNLCIQLIERAKLNGYISETPNQLTINCYEPGDGIPAHVDSVDNFGKEIVCLSLGSPIIMEFIDPQDGNRNGRRDLRQFRE
ncbi:hypothetical protein ACOME3_001316 [Neoechinorhynchus agilis]